MYINNTTAKFKFIIITSEKTQRVLMLLKTKTLFVPFSAFQFNSAKFNQIVLVRHAESVFNAKCHQYPADKIYSKQAEQQFHHDLSIMDCAITESGERSAKQDKLLNYFAHKSPANTLFFVSPMLRTLQTAQLILKVLNKNYEVKVLPQLSEVLSKICDFSSGINNKRQQYPQFDFRYLDQWNMEYGLCQVSENWQDPFLDKQLIKDVDSQSAAGKRYLKVLKQRFPKSLQSPQNCKLRSIEAFHKIAQITQTFNYKNAVVVSHNRILKNIEQYINKNEPKDFQNLEMRKFKIDQSLIKTQQK